MGSRSRLPRDRNQSSVPGQCGSLYRIEVSVPGGSVQVRGFSGLEVLTGSGSGWIIGRVRVE